MSNKALNRRLKMYLQAEKHILYGGQSYTIGTRTLTRADLSKIQDEINRLRAAGATEDDEIGSNNGYTRARRILFRD